MLQKEVSKYHDGERGVQEGSFWSRPSVLLGTKSIFVYVCIHKTQLIYHSHKLKSCFLPIAGLNVEQNRGQRK